MKTKKLFALTATLALLTSFTSCSSVKNTSDSPDGTPANGISNTVGDNSPYDLPDVNDMSDSYKAEDIKLPSEIWRTSDIIAFDDGTVLVIGIADDEKPLLYRTNADFAEFTPYSYDTPDYVSAADMGFIGPDFNTDGSFMANIELQDHGGLKYPETFDPDFDYNTFWESYTSTYKIAQYSADGRLIADTDIIYPESFYDDFGNKHISASISGGDCMLYITNDGKLWKADMQGNFTELCTLASDAGEFNSADLTHDRDGNIVCSAAFEIVGEDNSFTLQRRFYELKDDALSELSGGSNGYWDDELMKGAGKYRFFLSRTDGLFGYTDEGTLESVVNWLNSNVSQMYAVALGENEFIGWDGSSKRCYRLTPRDPAEYANATIVTLACPGYFGAEYVTDAINQFNRSHDDIILRIMSVPESDGMDKKTSFNMMMLSGNMPDIIYNVDYDAFVNYRKKGILADLYGIMDSNDGIKRGDLVENVAKALEAPDGGLYGICSTFSISSLVTKTSTWDKDSWTLDEFISVHDNAPSNFTHLYDGYTNMEMLHKMTYAMTDLIDWENAECHFDSPDFVKLLEFCGRYVNEVVKPDKILEQEANANYWEDYYHFLANDKVIFDESGIFDFNHEKYFKGNGADIKFVGFPTNESNGGIIYPGQLMSITSTSQHKEEAWEVIQHFMNYVDPAIYQNYDWYLYTLDDRLEKSLDKMFTNRISYSGWEQPVWDQETRDMMEDYIRSCTKLGTSYEDTFCGFDKAIMNVIDEEAMLYFGGDQTAQKAAENVQNRLSILVSERS